MKQIKVIEIIDCLKSEIIEVNGNIENVIVKYLRPSNLADESTLEWINVSKNNKLQLAEESKAIVIICDPEVTYSDLLRKQSKILIKVGNPKLAYAIVASKLFHEKPEPGISSLAHIHPKSVISPSVYIGAHCSIGICTIGNNTIIYPNVTIYDNVIIGDNCLIQAGAVIGTDGLGCERDKEGLLVKFPHLGGVIIENNVEIGANCHIAKGALSNTIIGQGTKINGLCFIAHNCIIGENVWITGNTMLAGTVKVGDNVNIYSGVIIREHRTIGNNAIIGMGSVVTKDVPAGETWIGSPAKKQEHESRNK